MSAVHPISPVHQHSTLRLTEDAQNQVFWMHMHAHLAHQPGRPCFSSQMLDDMLAFQAHVRQRTKSANYPQAFVVLASDIDVFNLGGDLATFVEYIRRRDRDSLRDYAHRSIDCVHGFHTGLGPNTHSISLVQGNALGGGMELALSCHTVIAEEGVSLGLPEVIFDLFPGMGAYSFLRQRVSPHHAQQLIRDGKTYSAHDLQAMGVIDAVVPRGQGLAAVDQVVRAMSKKPHAWPAIQRIRDIASPVTYEELLTITNLWVETALTLGDRSLRIMERLVRAQNQRMQRH